LKLTLTILSLLLTLSIAPTAYGQQDDPAVREHTCEQLAQLLEKLGPKVNIAFTRSEKQPYNYKGELTTGLTNATSLEVVVSATTKFTVSFRIYPHYNKGYINVDKASDRIGLMRLLLRLSDRAFLFWGADEEGDVFTGYTFTLESGFPADAIEVVLKSIVNSDKFVGEMKPFIVPAPNP
jgi:hypothetical protein